MAVDFIPINKADPNATLALDLRNAVEQLRAARTAVLRINDWMVHLSASPDYTQLELQFGLKAGDGAKIFPLVNGSLQVMDGTTSGYIKDFLARVA